MITRAIYSILFATAAVTNANVVEKDSRGKPGLLRNPQRVLKAAGKKPSKVPVCHFSDDVDAECPWKTITISEKAVLSHLQKHGDFKGTCFEKCAAEGGRYNAETCMCDTV